MNAFSAHRTPQDFSAFTCRTSLSAILGQLSNVTRTMNAQGRTETYTNVMPRYGLLHVVYRFNKQPKKNNESVNYSEQKCVFFLFIIINKNNSLCH